MRSFNDTPVVAIKLWAKESSHSDHVVLYSTEQFPYEGCMIVSYL
jgi:hypothetical protein